MGARIGRGRRVDRLPLRNLPWARAIQQLRNALGLGQVAFCDELGCSVAALSAWENGLTRPGRLAERALRDVAREHALELDLEAGTVSDQLMTYTAGRGR